MSLNIASQILSLPGQCVNHLQHDLFEQTLTLSCHRDRRYNARSPDNGNPCKINRYVSRAIRDLPLCGFDCRLLIELAQVITPDGRRVSWNIAKWLTWAVVTPLDFVNLSPVCVGI